MTINQLPSDQTYCGVIQLLYQGPKPEINCSLCVIAERKIFDNCFKTMGMYMMRLSAISIKSRVVCRNNNSS